MLQDVTLAAPLGERQGVVRSVCTIKEMEATYATLQAAALMTHSFVRQGNTEQRRTRQCSCMHEVRLVPLLACVPPLSGLHTIPRVLW